MPAQIRIKGAAELEAAFLELRRDVLREIKPALRKVAEIVRKDAEQKAGANISHIGPKWGRMRIGITPTVAYVAPRSRRSGGSPRPNLGGLLMNRAMQPALDENEAKLAEALEVVISASAARAGF